MPARPYVLAECTLPMVRQAESRVAVLPWGATEAHNLHLPYATDNLEAEAVAIESARRAWERGARAVVLPTLPFGVNTQQLDLPLTINMNPSTQALVLRDVVDSLAGQGVPNLVVLNFHGGNHFNQMVRELQARTTVFLSVVNGFAVVPRDGYFDHGGDHADELETSLLLHLAPDLVRPLDEAGPGAARQWRIQAFREKWAWAPRQWTKVTDDTGVGDPSAATADKGARYFDAVTAKVADFLVDLAEADPNDCYE
ncbi:Creatinine amidohydrolase [Posidoniimonas corsicana]|uniref:Creatinine amidohydrolase n=1 Tax=Posidoniimonas corsicana TaxID=1938618 RepID=A0A5C5VHK3_9BACT|nr:creatininase family protein [Posidoniimonas corsicana]TWT37225.1 Creatinine amidohydrolase [Posidoniimonas corsicana]